MAERQFGPYRLVRQIAVGGMAEIHLAKTKGIAGFEKYVALKMIHPNFAADDQFIQMLVDEAKIAVQLNHGNIAQTFDLGRVGDTYYITMEFVDGADLYKILRRGSEQEIDLPLDVCAFIAKEVASALDHAHRKRDHHGKPLGIVHRDVSPQNVLISYAGEVKLVDFGIAKATMKVKQTAVGVIKGKYYYMSPEQARGDSLDHRSDIFSAGIVLYEMMTGQMLYLEEDLHRLLDMARAANIASPTRLRKGIPPQLERIVMRALAKTPGDRYQSAGDFASDLERFLHAYSPVFTAAKIASLVKTIIGEHVAVPEVDIEVREGPEATFTLNPEDLIHDKEELHDENSVIFRLSELKAKGSEPKASEPKGSEPRKADRVTREANVADLARPRAATPPRAVQAATPPSESPLPKVASKRPSAVRSAHEDTRQVDAVPSGPADDSGLLASPAFDHLKTPVKRPPWEGKVEPIHNELDHGDNTLITGSPAHAHGFMTDASAEDGVEATLVTSAPSPERSGDDEGEDGETGLRPTITDDATAEDEGPTLQRDFRNAASSDGRRVTAKRGSPPALSAKIHAPAVSELRKPRASRKTPASGSPSNVLQAIVGAAPNEAMPVPPTVREDSGATTLPAQPTLPALAAQLAPFTPPQGAALFSTPPPGMPPQIVPGVPPHLQPYAQGEPFPAGFPGQQAPYPGQQMPYTPPQGFAYPPSQGFPLPPPPQHMPGALYQQGSPSPYPGQPMAMMSMTGQMRLYEVDELPAQYRVSGGGQMIKLVIAAVLAVSVAAGVTFFIIRSTRALAPTFGAIRVKSVPEGAEVSYDGTKLAGTTPMTIDEVPLATRHEIKVELAHHKPYVETVDVPKTGGGVDIAAILKPITGKLIIVTHPDGADVLLDGQLRGRTPTTVNDIDIVAAKKLELRLKDYQPYLQDLTWPANGEIDLERTLQR